LAENLWAVEQLSTTSWAAGSTRSGCSTWERRRRSNERDPRATVVQEAIVIMMAITVEPGTPGSARLEEVPEPHEDGGAVLVEALAVGVCGTDVEIAEGKYGWAPPGKTRLALGPRVSRPSPGSRPGAWA
jgi:hypothetical protein